MKLSATSVMMPELDLRQTFGLLSELGYDGVELRVRRLVAERANEKPSPWGRHLTNLSPENILQRSEEVKSVAKEFGIEIPAFATSCDAKDLEQVRMLSEGAKAVGCPAIRLSCRGYDGTVNYHILYAEAVKSYEKAIDITSSYGIRVLVEMHAGTIHPSASLAYRIVSNFDAKYIGVIYDPQNMVKDGFETIQIAFELLGDYLAHIHAGAHRPYPNEPDDRGIITWSWRACPLREGLYDFPKMVECLRKVDYQGFISIEDFRSDVSTEEKLKDAINYFRRL